MSRKKPPLWSTKGHSGSSSCIGHWLICPSFLSHLPVLKTTCMSNRKLPLKSLLTFISVKGRQSAFKEFPTRSSSVGLLLGCQGFKLLGHTCFWPRSALIRHHYHPMPAKQPAQNELLVSVQFLVGRCPWKGRKKNPLPLQLIWFSTLVGSLNSQPETEHSGEQRGGKKYFSTLKGLQSSADALWQNKLRKLSWVLPVL